MTIGVEALLAFRIPGAQPLIYEAMARVFGSDPKQMSDIQNSFPLEVLQTILLFLTFHGKSRADHDTLHHVHESPTIMIGPLLVLAIGAISAGVLLHGGFVGSQNAPGHAGDIAHGGSRQDALAVLAGQFGERAAGLVGAVTNPARDPGRDKHE